MDTQKLMVLDFLSKQNVEVRSWRHNQISGFQRIFILNNGVLAYVDMRVSNRIFVVDELFEANIGEYILAHEFGHIICRRSEENPLTQAYMAHVKDNSLNGDYRFMENVDRLKMEEEYLVDMFAVHMLKEHLDLSTNAMEQYHINMRMNSFNTLIGEEKRCQMNEIAFKMSKTLVY